MALTLINKGKTQIAGLSFSRFLVVVNGRAMQTVYRHKGIYSLKDEQFKRSELIRRLKEQYPCADQ
jgi:hypothetical protein